MTTSASQSLSSDVGRSPSEVRAAITLGIIGGGQLAKMTAQAAAQFGCEVVILERQADFPAGSLATRTLIGDWDEPESLLELASLVDVVTLENEFVDAAALAVLEQRGHKLWPSSATMRLIHDKFVQKQSSPARVCPCPGCARWSGLRTWRRSRPSGVFRSCSKPGATPTTARAT